jgi:hypothetical protein
MTNVYNLLIAFLTIVFSFLANGRKYMRYCSSKNIWYFTYTSNHNIWVSTLYISSVCKNGYVYVWFGIFPNIQELKVDVEDDIFICNMTWKLVKLALKQLLQYFVIISYISADNYLKYCLYKLCSNV